MHAQHLQPSQTYQPSLIDYSLSHTNQPLTEIHMEMVQQSENNHETSSNIQIEQQVSSNFDFSEETYFDSIISEFFEVF